MLNQNCVTKPFLWKIMATQSFQNCRKKEPFQAGIYLLKVDNRNTRTRCKVCSKLTIKTSERRHWLRSGFFIVNFEYISHLVVAFLLPVGLREFFINVYIQTRQKILVKPSIQNFIRTWGIWGSYLVTFCFETWYHAQCGYFLNFSTKGLAWLYFTISMKKRKFIWFYFFFHC